MKNVTSEAHTQQVGGLIPLMLVYYDTVANLVP